MIGVVIAVFLLDQWTKNLAVERLRIGEVIPLVGELLSIRLFYNSGAAFSLLAGSTIVFTILSVVVLTALALIVAPRVRTWLAAWALGLMTGGVAGNLHDRLLRPPGELRGHVVDFIALRGFAVFNVADIAITVAAGLLVIWSLQAAEKPSSCEKPSS